MALIPSLTALASRLPQPLVNAIKPIAMPFLRRRMKRLFSSFLSPGDLAFDIGAHNGDMADVLLSLGARVVCVEPQPRCLRELERRFGGKKSVIIVGEGVGEHEGELALSECPDNPALSTFSDKWKTGRFSGVRWAGGAMAKITTLDSLISRFGTPRFCKIDIEGFEPQALRGLSTPVRHVSFEFTREFIDDARLCADRLCSLGDARFRFSRYSEFSLEPKEWLPASGLFREISMIKDPNLCGDIYARTE